MTPALVFCAVQVAKAAAPATKSTFFGASPAMPLAADAAVTDHRRSNAHITIVNVLELQK